ncbi:hypothetical protein BBM19_23775 [Vibrio parahaemolyticus]|nr:hypothetical protein BBM19_23775 [Vibrio parahaemolyticus]
MVGLLQTVNINDKYYTMAALSGYKDGASCVKSEGEGPRFLYIGRCIRLCCVIRSENQTAYN